MNKTPENLLLKNALLFEQGHKRRTEHILKVYALTSAIASSTNRSKEEQTLLHAAAILHDIAIKPCKEHYNNASQTLQQKEAVTLIPSMLTAAGYDEVLYDSILYLVQNHHNYHLLHTSDELKQDKQDFQHILTQDSIMHDPSIQSMKLHDNILQLLQILIEADLLVNFMEEPGFSQEHQELTSIFKSEYALELSHVFIR